MTLHGADLKHEGIWYLTSIRSVSPIESNCQKRSGHKDLKKKKAWLLRAMRILVPILVIGWTLWFSIIIFQHSPLADLFERKILGLLFVDFAIIAVAILSLAEVVNEWHFDKTIARADQLFDSGDFKNAHTTLLSAQKANDRLRGSRQSRIIVLKGLLRLSRESGDTSTTLDLEHRIAAIEQEKPSISLAQLVENESLPNAANFKNRTKALLRDQSFHTAAIFSMIIFGIGLSFCPATTGGSILSDLATRLFGAAFTCHILFELLQGKLTGRSCVEWRRNPYNFSLTGGFHLSLGLVMAAMLVNSQYNALLIVGLALICPFICWGIGFLGACCRGTKS
ncbi:hypothetical protein BH10CYA1_BH10CYA1_05330 [soil metagenome]